MMDLGTLLERVREAKGPSSALDADLTEALTPDRPGGWERDGDAWVKGNLIRKPYQFTGSIDATVTLIGEVLPAAHWDVSDHDGFDNATSVGLVWTPGLHQGKAATPPLALLAALLIAVIGASP